MSKTLRYCLTLILVCFFSASITLAADRDRTKDRTRDQKKDKSCQDLISNQNIGFELAADRDRTKDKDQDRDRDQKKDGSCQS